MSLAEDPCVFAVAYKKSRFYWFSQREPKDPEAGAASSTGRDVFNEKPTLDQVGVCGPLLAQCGVGVCRQLRERGAGWLGSLVC